MEKSEIEIFSKTGIQKKPEIQNRVPKLSKQLSNHMF